VISLGKEFCALLMSVAVLPIYRVSPMEIEKVTGVEQSNAVTRLDAAPVLTMHGARASIGRRSSQAIAVG